MRESLRCHRPLSPWSCHRHAPQMTIPSPSPSTLPARRPRGRPPKPRSSPSANASRHGIFATNPVLLEIEQESDWDDHLAGQIAAFKPEGDLELVFVHRIALTLWRLNRIIGFECFALRPSERYLEQLTDLQRLYGPDVLLERPLPTGSIEHVQKYEAHLHRMLLKDLHEIEALQSRRRGDATPLARVEIN